MIQPMIVVTLPVLRLLVGFTLDFLALFQASTLVVGVMVYRRHYFPLSSARQGNITNQLLSPLDRCAHCGTQIR